ncbi:MAG TPA: PIN domain-containing protein [Leptospiraceae bacterium]|nr:PIN domain-containing protein [Leptospiraceae bacterium]HMW04865.1 PIN domain-containing protein [Leptospiraceae bacterium]HMX32548.1 PIN domain-containing protein [Leptospiraceae bacterium]HMY30914.1 PIN domain-containing protein [Leptospiraceae bacterium]HMZ62718.1 PIN domain-containing protein [Leptospiraceae bacterium]
MASNKDSKYPFWDTSGWFSLLVASESNHSKVRNISDELTKNKIPFFTSDLVIQETMTLLMARKETEKAKQFWSSLVDSKVVRIERIDETRFQKSGEYFSKHIDQGYSFVDASSFILMKEFKITKAVTTDKHFRKAGFIKLLA